MTRLRIVDAFTDRAFAGNPAAVIRLDDRAPDQLPDESWCQRMAAEINTPATGFVFPADGPDVDFRLRWFTASVELELCGHATLASSRCLFDDGVIGPIRFRTRSGVLTARQESSGVVTLEFPAQPAKQITPPDGLVDALGGAEPVWVGEGGGDYLVELADAGAVRRLQPDLAAIARYPVRGVIVTAASDVEQADFVSRFFPPSVGIAEDPVTGSAHTVLAPFWAERLGIDRLTGLQVSRRTGLVSVRLVGECAELTGAAVVVLDGELTAAVEFPVPTG
ncbi:MAG: PhzF family phenazine biosynthesis protein [Jatrophihabitantaceae bacterium]